MQAWLQAMQGADIVGEAGLGLPRHVRVGDHGAGHAAVGLA